MKRGSPGHPAGQTAGRISMARLQISAEFIRSSTATVFQPISTADHDSADRYTIRPEAPSKGISRKGRTHRTVAGLWQDIERYKQGFLPQTNPFRLQNLSIILNLEHRNIAGEA